MNFTIKKEELNALHDILKKKMATLSDEDGSYADSDLENGTYASGYMQCLIDVYKLLK